MLQRVTVTEQATDALRSLIVDRSLLPGQQVTEEAMAARIGVSRPTVRQALATLQMEGLLTRNSPNRVLEVTTLSSDDVVDIYRARRVIELAGVEAISRAPQDRLDAITEVSSLIERSVALGDTNLRVEADYRSHRLVVGLLDSPTLSVLHDQLLTRLRLAIVHMEFMASRGSAVLETHLAFCDDVAHRRVRRARQELERRLNESERLILESIEHRDAAG